MPKKFDKPNSSGQIADFTKLNTQNLQVQGFHQMTQKTVLRLNVKQKGNYTFPIAYFPSWNGYLDGAKVKISQASKGIAVNLPKGEHSLVFSFENTPIELFSDLVSLSAILFLFGYNLKKYGKS